MKKMQWISKQEEFLYIIVENPPKDSRPITDINGEVYYVWGYGFSQSGWFAWLRKPFDDMGWPIKTHKFYYILVQNKEEYKKVGLNQEEIFQKVLDMSDKKCIMKG